MTPELETTQDFLAHHLGQLTERQLLAVTDIVRAADYPCPTPQKVVSKLLKYAASFLEAEVGGSSADIHKACSELAALCIHRISILK